MVGVGRGPDSHSDDFFPDPPEMLAALGGFTGGGSQQQRCRRRLSPRPGKPGKESAQGFLGCTQLAAVASMLKVDTASVWGEHALADPSNYRRPVNTAAGNGSHGTRGGAEVDELFALFVNRHRSASKENTVTLMAIVTR
jgi:hypothetical protein